MQPRYLAARTYSGLKTAYTTLVDLEVIRLHERQGSQVGIVTRVTVSADAADSMNLACGTNVVWP
jgi:hypothetical protein